MILFILTTMLSCSSNKKADTIILNGAVYTVDKDKPNAEAIAIKDGNILAVGTNEEIQLLQGKNTEIIDAKNQFVMPGFIEGHGHFSSLGKSLQQLNFIDSKNWDEIVELVEARVKTAKPGEWITGRGWHQEKWDEHPGQRYYGYPSYEKLSAISPDNPVMLYHASGHGLFANKKAMELANISIESAAPAGGAIIRKSSGEAIGVFEENAMDLVSDVYNNYLKQQDQDKLREIWEDGIQLAIQECLRTGITSFQDAGSSFGQIKDYTNMAKSGKLGIRLWAMIRRSSDEMRGRLQKIRVIDAGDGFFTCRAVKTEIDGALGSYGAWLLDDYADKPGFKGQNTTSIKEVEAIAELAAKNNMQLCIHAIGDKGNQVILDMIEEKFPNTKDKRWRLEHAQHLAVKDIPRFKELGVIASMQAIHCTSDSPFVEDRLGKERAKTGAYPWRSLLDAGAVVSNGTDAPIENVDPIPSIYASMTRKRGDNPVAFYPEQSMTREEALYSYTMSNAYAAFEEDKKGSITVGKYADIIILDKNLLTCPEDEILNTKVLMTMVGGKVKYRAK